MTRMVFRMTVTHVVSLRYLLRYAAPLLRLTEWIAKSAPEPDSTHITLGVKLKKPQNTPAIL